MERNTKRNTNNRRKCYTCLQLFDRYPVKILFATYCHRTDKIMRIKGYLDQHDGPTL